MDVGLVLIKLTAKERAKRRFSWFLTESDLLSLPEARRAPGSCPLPRHRVREASAAAERALEQEPLASNALVPQDTVRTL